MATIYILQACNVGGFRIQSLWNVHVESVIHCSTILKLFYSMDNKDFFRLYGEVPYSKSKDVSQQSEYSNDIERHMAVRSGILNEYDCRVRSLFCFVFSFFCVYVSCSFIYLPIVCLTLLGYGN